MSHLALAHVPTRDSLPPRDVWRYDPRRDGLLETPLDERGLADLDKLVELVKQTVDPEYSWVSSFNDVHHLQWSAALYTAPERREEMSVDLRAFRELVNRKAYVPRIFHNRAHQVTVPPPVPPHETILYSLEAQRVAIALAKTSSLAVRLTRMVHIPSNRLAERLEQEFEHYNLYLDNARLVPREFSLLAIGELEASSVDEMLQRNKLLGKKALDRIPIRLREVLA